MTMLDILKNRLPDGLTITDVKERSSKYLIKFSYDGNPLGGQGELAKACIPGKENMVCDTTIQVVMTEFMLDKGDWAGAKQWMDYIKKASVAQNVEDSATEAILKIIHSHNAVITAIEESGIFTGDANIWRHLAYEGADISAIARDNKIDVKCDVQTGKIIVDSM